MEVYWKLQTSLLSPQCPPLRARRDRLPPQQYSMDILRRILCRCSCGTYEDPVPKSSMGSNCFQWLVLHLRLFFLYYHKLTPFQAVTHAQIDFPQYYDPIQEYGPRECISTLQRAIIFIDNILDHPRATGFPQLLKRLFGLGALEDDDFADVISSPLGYWQEKNWDPAGTSLHPLCSYWWWGVVNMNWHNGHVDRLYDSWFNWVLQLLWCSYCWWGWKQDWFDQSVRPMDLFFLGSH